MSKAATLPAKRSYFLARLEAGLDSGSSSSSFLAAGFALPLAFHLDLASIFGAGLVTENLSDSIKGLGFRNRKVGSRV